MKISEMEAILKVVGWLPERACQHDFDGKVNKINAIWRVVDSNKHSVLRSLLIPNKAFYAPITPWYKTKISALRAAMYKLENQDG